MVDFSYRNVTSNIVVLKCIGPNRYFLERAISPKEVFSYIAPEGSQLEIWGIESYGPKLEQRLRVSATQTEDPLAAYYFTVHN